LVTDRDRQLLRFVAAHRFVLAAHVQAWLGPCMSVCYRRLDALTNAGLLTYRRIFHAQPGCYQITNGGLGLAGSDLPRPKIDLRTYAHDSDLVWLWLAAHQGQFGDTKTLLAEREMRHHDQLQEPFGERFRLELIGVGAHGRPRLHYPDVLVVRTDGHQVAVELELTLKSRRRLSTILAAYSARPGLKVMYFTSSRAVTTAIQEAAAAVGVEELVQVRQLPQPSRQGVVPVGCLRSTVLDPEVPA